MNEQVLIDAQGRKIPRVIWNANAPIAQMVLVHGFAEHYRPYSEFAKKLNQANITVQAFDLPGHGLAEGLRCHIDSFQDYLDILQGFIQQIESDLPLFLFGHSMGGLISGHYAIQNSAQLKGLILSSPLTGFDGVSMQLMGALGRWLNQKYPTKSMPKLFNPKELSNLEERWPQYQSDPLRGQTITPSMFVSMLDWAQLLHKNAHLLTLPLLTFYSKADRVVSPSGIERFFAATKSRDKELVAFTESGHEILQSREEPQMTQKLIHWIINRLK